MTIYRICFSIVLFAQMSNCIAMDNNIYNKAAISKIATISNVVASTGTIMSTGSVALLSHFAASRMLYNLRHGKYYHCSSEQLFLMGSSARLVSIVTGYAFCQHIYSRSRNNNSVERE